MTYHCGGGYFIKFVGVTLVHRVIWLLGVHCYDTWSVYCIVCLPPKSDHLPSPYNWLPLIVALICISLKISEVEYLFICSLALWISSSVQVFLSLNNSFSPGWWSSVDWVLACELKGHQFDSQPGHMPGLQARSPVGGMQESTTHWCFFPCLSLSLPLSLKINK